MKNKQIIKNLCIGIFCFIEILFIGSIWMAIQYWRDSKSPEKEDKSLIKELEEFVVQNMILAAIVLMNIGFWWGLIRLILKLM